MAIEGLPPILNVDPLRLSQGQSSPNALASRLSGGELEAVLAGRIPGGLLLRLPDGEAFAAGGELPFPEGTQLLLRALPAPETAGLRLQLLRATPPPPAPVLTPLAQGEAAALLRRILGSDTLPAPFAPLRALLTPALEQPENLERWLRHAAAGLSSPEASPREAPFHVLQAKEGTALFELPLPLQGFQGPVELWVEQDREGGAGRERTVRALLAFDLEGMGQARLGVEGRGASIRATLWVDEARREAVDRALRAELGEPPAYPVRVLGFHGPQPGLRQTAGAEAFGALG